MLKPVVVKFDEAAYKEFQELQAYVAKGTKTNRRPGYGQLLASINVALRNIKANIYFGDLIPRKYISSQLVQRYGTDKILRVELVGYWRLLYTLIGDEVEIIAFILEYMDHKKYDKAFGYKKK